MGILYNYEFVKEKMNKELKECQKSSNPKIKVICTHVADKLIQFAENKTFGLEIQKSENTLLDCCKAVTKNVEKHISDIEVYKKAVQFYFPSADIEFKMDIIIDNQPSNNNRISISLDDLF